MIIRTSVGFDEQPANTPYSLTLLERSTDLSNTHRALTAVYDLQSGSNRRIEQTIMQDNVSIYPHWGQWLLVGTYTFPLLSTNETLRNAFVNPEFIAVQLADYRMSSCGRTLHDCDAAGEGSRKFGSTSSEANTK